MLVYWIWLSRLPHITWQQKRSLLQRFGDPEAIYQLPDSVLSDMEGISPKTVAALSNKDLTASRRIIRECREKSIGLVAYNDSAYPKRLKNIEDPPLVLYYKGILPDWQGAPTIGVVGTRKASMSGLKNAKKLGYEMACSGAIVVSGGADGIDTAALEGALLAGKPVVAVLGFGADVVYPAKNRDLFRKIEKQGCLLTEYVPGTPAAAWNFPMRNRIISGLSAGVLVVEAPKRSGALNTAHHAMDQGRDVFVVPGSMDQESCAGSNELLRERAIAVMSGWDVMQEYDSLYPGAVHRFVGVLPEASESVCRTPSDKKSIDNRAQSQYSVINKKEIQLSTEEAAVIACVEITPRPVDEVLAQLDMPAGKALSILTRLALKGYVKNHPGKLVSLAEGYQS